MRYALLFTMILTALAGAQGTRFQDPAMSLDSPLKLQRLDNRLRQIALLDTIDGSDEVTVADFDSTGAADNNTLGLQSATPTARRGSGSYTEVTWEGDADDYLEFKLVKAFPTGRNSKYSYLCVYVQSDATTAAQVAAQGTLTLSGQPTTADTFLLGTRTYTLRTTATGAANEILIGSTAAITVTNIVAVVNSQDTAIATARDGAANIVIFTSKTPGLASDSEVLTESMDNTTVDGAGTLGGTRAGTDADYQIRFQDNAGTTILTANVPAIDTASVWQVLEIPLWGTTGGLPMVKYIDWVQTTTDTDQLSIERMILTDYANGGGPVAHGVTVASMQLPTAVTDVLNRGDLIGWDPGTMFQTYAAGVSNENYAVGYIIGGAGGGGGTGGSTVLVQINGPITVKAGAAPAITLARPVYAAGVDTIDGTGTSAVGLGTALETQTTAGAFVEILLHGAGGTTATVSADSVDGTELADTITLDAAFVLGANGQTIAIDSSDWDIGTTGIMTGIGNITSDGVLDVNNITVDAGKGIDNQAAGALLIGAATATSVEIGDAGVTTDLQGPVTILGTTGVGLDTAGATAMYIAEATATSVELGAADITTNVVGALTILGTTGNGLDAATGTALYVGEATATSLVLGASDITTIVAGPLTVLGATTNGIDTTAAAALYLGEAVATSVAIGASDITTTVLGLLECLEGAGKGIDTAGAGIMEIGFATATAVNIGKSGIDTDVQGTLSVDEVATFDATVVFSGGQTRELWIPAQDLTLDGTVPPTAATIGTSGTDQLRTLQFDADGGATGDDYCHFNWRIPRGYMTTGGPNVTVVWLHTTAETGSDAVAWDGQGLSLAEGEAYTGASTAITVVSDTGTDGNANQIQETALDFSGVTVAVDDLLRISIFCDESASAMTGVADMVGVLVKWESSE